MWEPRRLTILWASTARYRDSFTFFIGLKKVKLSLCLIKHLNMKMEGEVEAQSDTFLTSSATANEYLDSSFVRFTLARDPWNPLYRRLCEPQPIWMLWRKVPCYCRESNPYSLVVQTTA
jgi:hypothetical protein